MEHRKTRKTRIGWTEWIQVARRQRPLLKGVPREWRGMYTAGGASTNVFTAYMDFWHLIMDTYPPASPYPSEEGTRGGGPSVVTLWNIERHERHERHELGGLSGCKRHGGSVPF